MQDRRGRPMKVTNAELVISAVRPEQYPADNQPEVALAGRSNVGKSSFINRLIQRKGLVRSRVNPARHKRSISTISTIRFDL